MATKSIFVNKYDNYKERKGKVFTGESVTDKSKAIDCDIYACIEKYGIGSLMRKTMATEYLYEDLTQKPKSLEEAIEMRQTLNEYFAQQPATVRKQFGDSAEMFYQKFTRGEYDDFIKTGVLSNEIAERYKEAYNENKTTIMEETNPISTDIPTNINPGNTQPMDGN